jgi:hypothetical protein
MGRITVRVVPRSNRRVLEAGAGDPVIRVRAAPEGGRANAEAVRVLADALGVARTTVRLVRGSRSRVKTFAVQGRSDEELRDALNRL